MEKQDEHKFLATAIISICITFLIIWAILPTVEGFFAALFMAYFIGIGVTAALGGRY